MEGEGKVGSPNEWVRELAGRRVLKAQEEGVGVILIGDLNRDWGQLRPWAERFGLGDLTDGSGQTTTGAVRVDHILGWNTEVYNWGIDMGDTAIGSGNISDHRAMWCEVAVEVIPKRLARANIKKPAAVTLGTEDEWRAFREEVQERGKKDGDTDMEGLMKRYVNAVRKVRPPGRGERKNHYGGWSPALLGLKAYLNFLRRLRYHLVGRKGYLKWRNGGEIRAGVMREAEEWERVRKRLDLEPGLWEDLDKIGGGAR